MTSPHGRFARTLFALAFASCGALLACGCTNSAEIDAIGTDTPRAFEQGRVKDVLVILRRADGRNATDELCDRVKRRFAEALTQKGYGVVSGKAPEAPATASTLPTRGWSRSSGIHGNVTTAWGETNGRGFGLTADDEADDEAVRLAGSANASAALVVTLDDRIDVRTKDPRTGKVTPTDGWVTASLLLGTGEEVWQYSGVAPELPTVDTTAAIERAAAVVAAQLPRLSSYPRPG
jgi:hypothetical protein